MSDATYLEALRATPRFEDVMSTDEDEIDALYRALEIARSGVIRLENEIAERWGRRPRYERDAWARQNTRLIHQRMAGIGRELVR